MHAMVTRKDAEQKFLGGPVMVGLYPWPQLVDVHDLSDSKTGGSDVRCAPALNMG